MASTQGLPQLVLAVEAQLYARDVRASAAYFRDTLKFEIEFLYGEPPYYGLVKRSGARLALRCVDEPVFVSNVRERLELLSAAITLETAADTRALFSELETAGAVFHQGLAKKPWGALNFIVKDPDGNLLLFAGPAD